MKRTNDLRKNFIWNLIGLSFYGFISLFLLIIVKRVNGLDISGIFSYAYSICTLVFYISLYYSRTYQIANYDNNKSFNQFISARVLSVILSLFLILMFCFVSKFDTFKIIVIMLLMLFRSVDAISDTFYGYLQEHEKLYQVGISYTLKSVIGTFLFLVVDLITNNICLSIGALLFVNVVFFYLYDYYNFKKLYKDRILFDISNIKLIAKEAFPIFIFTFLAIFLSNAQKYVLVYISSNELQSIFAMIIMPATVLSLVGNYLINPFINKLNLFFKNGEIKEFNSLSMKIILSLFLIGIVGVFVCYFIGIPILNIIYSINLDQYRICLTIIIFASILNALSMIFSSLLIILNKNNIQTLFYLISSVIAVFVCLFISDDVIMAATLSYLISYSFNIIVYYLYYCYVVKKLK